MAEILITAGAEEDYTESLCWYAKRSLRAARGFDAAFSRALDAIAADPDMYPWCDGRHQFFLLKRYPFQVIFRKKSSEKVLIVAVAHTSRRPGYWLER
jgi:plasmid stabilization system protein ParE